MNGKLVCMDQSDLITLQPMNLKELRDFAEQRSMSPKTASRLWYALARKALSESQDSTDDKSLTFDKETETLYFHQNPQEYAERLRNIGKVSLKLLEEFIDYNIETRA